MNQPLLLKVTKDKTTVLAYLIKHLQDSRLVEYLGSNVLNSEFDYIATVTASEPPHEQRFASSFGGKVEPCKTWLIQEVISYLQNVPNAAVLFEDPVSLPSDTVLASREHPPFWHHKDRVFWPVLPFQANHYNVEQAMSWAAGMREIAFFCLVPENLLRSLELRLLSDEDITSIASTITRIVTDVFDGEGYIVWNRRGRQIRGGR